MRFVLFNKMRKESFANNFDKVVHVSIFVSFLIFALETVKELREYDIYFEVVELVSLIIFSIEYVYRIFVAYPEKRSLKYIFSFIGIIDLLSILPLFIPFISSFDLRFIKVFRLFSLFRIFKLYRYSEHLQAITKVVTSKKDDLLATLFSILIVLVFCSCLAYYFEKDAQPAVFSNLFQAMYWGVSTLATIGYGDIYPVTIGGKLTATILAMLGVGLVTIPSAILSAGFIEEIQNRRLQKVNFTPPPAPTVMSKEPSHNARRHETAQTDMTPEEQQAIK
ncbi:MAG TPA: ion transporter [Cytophagaceae bacterium]|nr:ion transporter [Cytophagaceae bacterium]